MPGCYHGRPGVASYLARFEDRDPNVPAYESINLRGLPSHLKLEMQYALQCRRDEETIKTPADPVRGVVLFLLGSGVTSFLDWPEDAWRQRFPATSSRKQVQAALAVYARRAVEDLAYGRGWQVEYPRDEWRLRNLGIGGPRATIRFGRISQPWLKELVKRWTRYRLSTGLGPQQAGYGALALTRFSVFLAEGGAISLASIGRELLERYLGRLHDPAAGRTIPARDIGQLSAFFDAIRRHGWDDTLPATATFYPEDFPKQRYRLPRALAEHVMAQLEDPANLDRWDNPAYRLITVILMRCGLRISSALTLPFDCITRDAGGAPYLRYVNTKMKREALVPIDEELAGQIAGQQQRTLQRWRGGTPVLFPRPKANIRGDRTIGSQSYREALHTWLERCDIRDERGNPARITPHQWRHTLGTRLINRDVPQEVVRRILDHDSPQMTAHYARLHDTTVREHWERARKVDAHGETVTLGPGGPLADAAWARQRLGRATQALPNGYCGLPVQRSCPHANACLTCPMFLTTAEFLPRHREHRQQVLRIVSAAEARGQERVAEMNRQVAANLEKIITTLETSRKGRRWPVRADNTAAIIAAARTRSELTRSNAIRALRELDAAGTPVSFEAVARRRASPVPGCIPSQASAPRSSGYARPPAGRRAWPSPPGSAPPTRPCSPASRQASNATANSPRKISGSGVSWPTHSASNDPPRGPASTTRPAETPPGQSPSSNDHHTLPGAPHRSEAPPTTPSTTQQPRSRP